MYQGIDLRHTTGLQPDKIDKQYVVGRLVHHYNPRVSFLPLTLSIPILIYENTRSWPSSPPLSGPT